MTGSELNQPIPARALKHQSQMCDRAQHLHAQSRPLMMPILGGPVQITSTM